MEKTGIQITVHDTPATLRSNPWRHVTEWLEYDLAVKWFAVEARRGEELAGFMHLVRHPGRAGEWYACDVHTLEPYQRQGIASAMYREAEAHLRRYFRANRITAAVSRGNTASVRLHEILGFRDTREVPAFPDFRFEPDETLYEHYFAREIPAVNVPMHQEILASLAGESRESVLGLLEQSASDPGKKVYIIWAGSDPIGYRFSGEKEPVLKAEWKQRYEDRYLTVGQG